MAKLRKLIRLEKAYDSLYDLNNEMNYKFKDTLELMRKEAIKYGYKIKLNSRDKFKLYAMTQKEFKEYKEVE